MRLAGLMAQRRIPPDANACHRQGVVPALLKVEAAAPSLSRPDGPVPPEVGCSRLEVYEARLVSAL